MEPEMEHGMKLNVQDHCQETESDLSLNRTLISQFQALKLTLAKPLEEVEVVEVEILQEGAETEEE